MPRAFESTNEFGGQLHIVKHHVVMEKATKQGRAVISARSLEDKEDVRAEIARMLAGDAQSTEALKHAEALLKRRRAG